MEMTDYDLIYKNGNPPWDHGSPDYNLDHIIKVFSIQPCKALDIGCGWGNNVLWLAENRFHVHGFDLSEAAIIRARQRSLDAGHTSTFQVGNFLCDPVENAPFDFVFDRGCLHCFCEKQDRTVFAENVAGILEEHGLWLSLVGNADEPKREIGPPQLSVQEIAASAEPFFEILSLASGYFGDKQEDPPQAWICLMRKRC